MRDHEWRKTMTIATEGGPRARWACGRCGLKVESGGISLEDLAEECRRQGEVYADCNLYLVRGVTES